MTLPVVVDSSENECPAESEMIENDDENMLVKYGWPQEENNFLTYLRGETLAIKTIVSHHLFLQKHQECVVADCSQWLRGSYNVCIPVRVSNWRLPRVLIRCPLPNRLSSVVDEKLRCEGGTAAYFSELPYRVPIPRLSAVGLSDGLSFTSLSLFPWYIRAMEYVKQSFAWFCGRPYSRPFIPTRCPSSLRSGYLLMDFIEKEQGVMLSETWPLSSDQQRDSFFRSLSRIILDIACPQKKIGSFTMSDSGYISLSNRPLTRSLANLETEGIPTEIPKEKCYLTAQSYAHDLLRCHDQRLIYQPNAVRDEYDCRAQMAALAMMRAILPTFVPFSSSQGQFIPILTDLNKTNIFHKDGVITGLIDYEWTCSLPIERLHPPFWISGYEFDEFDTGNEQDKRKRQAGFNKACEDFMAIFEDEDYKRSWLPSGSLTRIIKDGLEHKRNWFWATLNIPHATYNLFSEHLQPLFAPEHSETREAVKFERIAAPYWTMGAAKFVNGKILQQQVYKRQLRQKLEICV